MQKMEYSFLILVENRLVFYEANREPRVLFQLKKAFILDFSNRSDPDFYLTLLKAINLVADEGWELSATGQGVLIWYFKRPLRGK